MCPHIIRPKGSQVCNCIWARSCSFHGGHLLWLVYELEIGSEPGPRSANLQHRLSLRTSVVLMNKATGGMDQEGKDNYWIWFVWSKKKKSGKESEVQSYEMTGDIRLENDTGLS